MKFRCRGCGTILTRDLSNKSVELCEEDGKDLIPEGFTLQNDKWSDGRWFVNAKDNLSMEIIDNPKRLNGCCDLDGCDGPNLVCKSCKAEVATAKYDCWMPRRIIISNEGADAIT
jgi:hypothetical protein